MEIRPWFFIFIFLHLHEIVEGLYFHFSLSVCVCVCVCPFVNVYVCASFRLLVCKMPIETVNRFLSDIR